MNVQHLFKNLFGKAEAKENILLLNLKEVAYVLTNRRPRESLVYYKDETSRFMGNSIGEKILKFINKETLYKRTKLLFLPANILMGVF